MALTYIPAARYPLMVNDVEFRRTPKRTLLARVYQPQGAGPFPVLLDLHGGAWFDKDRLANAPMDEALAASGILVVAIDLTLAPEAPYPASVQDANYGIRWLKSKAPEWKGDPATLGALGSSSSELSNLFQGPTRVWSYAGSIVGPIFTFGAVSGQVAQSEAAQQAALLNYQLSIQNAFADVDNALVANQKLKDQLAAQERLVSALKERRIAGAGLDVFANEPQVPAELMALDNVVLVPHIGSATIETRSAMAQRVFDNLKSYFDTGKLVSQATA